MDVLLERSKSGLLRQLAKVNQNHGSTTVPKAAQALGVDPTIIKAILVAETGGQAIRTGGSIQFLFMIGNHFTPKYKRKFPDRPLPSWAGKSMSGSRSVLRQAINLWSHGALTNTSWGIFQIHGWSYRKLGYGSPKEMVQAFKNSGEAQIQGFIDFVRTKKRLYNAIKAKDWWAIARFYNGDKRGKYARWMQTIYNAENPSQQDNSRIASSRRQYAKLKKAGQVGAGTASADAGVRPQAGRVVLFGDSNAGYINMEYAKYFRSRGAEVLALHRNGSGANYWIKVLDRVTAGRSGGNSHAKKILAFRPTTFHCTSLGGNDGGNAYKASTLSAYVERKIKPLMQMMKKFPGSTFSGLVPIGSKRTYKGVPSNELRSKMNAAMAKAANEVGIAFWNPTSQYSYDVAELDRRKAKGTGDDVHINRSMARQEVEARSGFLGGQAVASSAAIATASGAQGEEAERARQERQYQQMTQLFQNMLHKRDEFVRQGPPKHKDVKRALAAAQAEQNAPTPEEHGEDTRPVQLPGKKGVVLAKYIKFLKKHQPDFDFDKFYGEIDSYLKSVKKKDILSDRDYVFGDEHYEAFVLVRNLKDREAQQALSEGLVLHNLIREVREKWAK